jgi:hypothetical protein
MALYDHLPVIPVETMYKDFLDRVLPAVFLPTVLAGQIGPPVIARMAARNAL